MSPLRYIAVFVSSISGTVNGNLNRQQRSMTTTAINFQTHVAALREELLQDINQDQRRRQTSVAGVQNEVQSLRNEVTTIHQEIGWYLHLNT